jgi:hypothetical protein
MHNKRADVSLVPIDKPPNLSRLRSAHRLDVRRQRHCIARLSIVKHQV